MFQSIFIHHFPIDWDSTPHHMFCCSVRHINFNTCRQNLKKQTLTTRFLFDDSVVVIMLCAVLSVGWRRGCWRCLTVVVSTMRGCGKSMVLVITWGGSGGVPPRGRLARPAGDHKPLVRLPHQLLPGHSFRAGRGTRHRAFPEICWFLRPKILSGVVRSIIRLYLSDIASCTVYNVHLYICLLHFPMEIFLTGNCKVQ